MDEDFATIIVHTSESKRRTSKPKEVVDEGLENDKMLSEIPPRGDDDDEFADRPFTRFDDYVSLLSFLWHYVGVYSGFRNNNSHYR